MRGAPGDPAATGRVDRPLPNDPQWSQWRRDQISGIVRKVFAREPHWKALTPRLVGVGLLPDDKPAIERILKEGANEAKTP